ncbi:MAG TPA: folylpolyglutamate synthase/dihydrofolate synthase family protein, partial [Thermomicrobiales bacterium]|nr:folylpolyglutamate synthase/dihydrofolate synthase family protein [Thermomicrobiales bacterium]
MNTYAEALAAIRDRSAYGQGFVSDPFWGDEAARLGLRRMAALLERLGRPDRRYPIIHVAGSKGKGSTCAFAASVLRAAGYRVGLTTSPHLHSFRERIAVGGEMISEAAFAALTERIAGEAEALEAASPALGRVTAFELLTAMALDHFAAMECDVAVVEVGMGGALDATNVVTPAVSAITALDYEHTLVLGSTLAEIAANKAGIIKTARPVVVAEQATEAMAVIADVAARQQSTLYAAGQDWHAEGHWRNFTAIGPWGAIPDLRVGLAGGHQVTNACLALAAVTLVSPALAVSEELERGLRAGVEAHHGQAVRHQQHPYRRFDQTWETAARAGLASASLPGRFEVVEVDGRLVVLDGAHSLASARALATTLSEAYPVRQAILVVGTAADKRIDAIAEALSGNDRCVLATHARSPRAAETDHIARAFQRVGLPVREVHDVAEALGEAMAMAGEADLIVVTGSFRVVAEARE